MDDFFNLPVGEKSLLTGNPAHHRIDDPLKHLQTLPWQGTQKPHRKRIQPHFLKAFTHTGGKKKRQPLSLQMSLFLPPSPVGPACQWKEGETQNL